MKTFTTRFRVRYNECDPFGRVNHATYLNYMEFAREEAMRQQGLTPDALQKLGFAFFIRRVEIDYKYPLMIGDEVELRSFVSDTRKTSFTVSQQVFEASSQRLAAEAKVVCICSDLSGQPIEIPTEFKDAFGIEAE